MTAAFPELDPLSPELALVDPELAARARALLPLPGEFRPGWWHEPAEGAFAAEHPPAPRPEPRPVSPRPRRVARRAALIVAFAATAVAGFGLGYAWDNRPASAPPVAAAAEPSTVRVVPPTRAVASTVARRPPTHRPTVTPSHSVTPARTVAPAAKRAQAKKPVAATKPARRAPQRRGAATPRATTTVPTRRATPRATTTVPTRRATPRPAARPRRAAAPARSTGFVPARTWSWVAVAGATAYRVTFVRDGKAFYSATTPEPRLELPARVKFAPGRYSWRVVPVVAGKPGADVVDSTFIVK